eukprot:GHVR01095476.1.p1 GENE.GHVR01095476.1~~GHVR01095476.1.p1  ORF type:complete len:572 (+),score=177.43 GHVR01095476.1:36-1718(+)
MVSKKVIGCGIALLISIIGICGVFAYIHITDEDNKDKVGELKATDKDDQQGNKKNIKGDADEEDEYIVKKRIDPYLLEQPYMYHQLQINYDKKTAATGDTGTGGTGGAGTGGAGTGGAGTGGTVVNPTVESKESLWDRSCGGYDLFNFNEKPVKDINPLYSKSYKLTNNDIIGVLSVTPSVSLKLNKEGIVVEGDYWDFIASTFYKKCTGEVLSNSEGNVVIKNIINKIHNNNVFYKPSNETIPIEKKKFDGKVKKIVTIIKNVLDNNIEIFLRVNYSIHNNIQTYLIQSGKLLLPQEIYFIFNKNNENDKEQIKNISTNIIKLFKNIIGSVDPCIDQKSSLLDKAKKNMFTETALMGRAEKVFNFEKELFLLIGNYKAENTYTYTAEHAHPLVKISNNEVLFSKLVKLYMKEKTHTQEVWSNIGSNFDVGGSDLVKILMKYGAHTLRDYLLIATVFKYRYLWSKDVFDLDSGLAQYAGLSFPSYTKCVSAVVTTIPWVVSHMYGLPVSVSEMNHTKEYISCVCVCVCVCVCHVFEVKDTGVYVVVVNELKYPHYLHAHP